MKYQLALRKISLSRLLSSRLSCAVVTTAAFLSYALMPARAALLAHNISAANLSVVQNDDGNVEASVTVTPIVSVNDFRARAGGNSKGDFTVQIGDDATDDPANGIMMTSVSENGRDHYGTGLTNCISMIDFNAGGYWIPANSAIGAAAGANPEFNINVAGAWFPYTNWLGGFARNSTGANGGPLDLFISSPSLTLGVNFVDLGSGKSIVNLTNLGIDARVDGVLLVTGAKNESANFGLAGVNTTNGTWNLFIKDDGQGTITSFEQDPIAFVFIPKTNTTVVSGRFLGDGSIEMYSGNSPQFTVTSNNVGTYELKLAGYSATNGILIISAEGGRAINQDNMVSYQLNEAQDGWIIQSRDVPGTAALPAPLESPGPTEGVVSFVFIPGPTPGFSVIPTNNLLTTESGGTANFTVALHTQPTDDVVIAISSANVAEGAVSTNSLTFTTNDWNIAQTVTITGQDDVLVDGAVGYTIILAAAISTDPNYTGLNPSDVSVVNADNEGGLTVSPTSGLVTTEGGGTNSFTIVLNTQPAGSVTIGLSSSDTTEGAVSPASVTFSPSDWNVPQTLTLTGVDDVLDDGDIAYTIITAPATSSDPTYNGLNPADVSASNTDNDTSGITVSASGPNGLLVVEGHTNGYTVVLDSQPSADVVVNISSSNTSQGGTVAPATLTFTPANWSNAQPVTVTGIDDLVADANTAYFITNAISSSDLIYGAIAPIIVLTTTLNNEAVLSLPSGDMVYGIGLPGVGIDGRAVIDDPNTPNYDSATLAVTLTANGSADDRLEVRNTGTDLGQIGVSGNTVSFGGTPIGTFAGGSGVTPLVVTFNSSATPAAGQALLRSITFRNVNSIPSLDRRSVSVVLTDSDTSVASAITGIRLGLVRATSFQEGADHGYGGYTGEADIQLQEGQPNTAFPAGGGSGLFIDWPDLGSLNSFHTLLRFDNIFGDGPGQIPTNAVIVSADLLLDVNDTGDASPLYRMLIPWDATNDTWTSTGGGIQTDDVEARSVADSEFGLANGDASTTVGTITFSVRPDLEAWQTNAANYGWVMPGWPTRTDGTGFSPSEAADTNDRPRLRVLWLPAGTVSASFRQGVNDYTNAFDTRIRQAVPDSEFSTLTGVFVDAEVTGGQADPEQVLLRFDEMFGVGPGQIPPGSTIHAAILDLAAVIGNAMGDGGRFHAMLQPWQDTSTWNSLIDGITADNVEAVVTATAAAGNAILNPNVQAGRLSFELTPDVQAWANGVRANYGWVILPWPGGGDGWGFGTAEQGLEENRPRLRVFYTPGAPVAPNIVMQPPVVSPGSVQVNFSGAPSTSYHVLRAPAVTGPWTTNGTVVTGGNGSGVHTDNTPLPGGAFYRVFQP